MASPLWQKPLELGADCVIYSATKHIDGQGRCVGGAKSLAVHPATTTHQRFSPDARAAMGVGEGLVRLSIGLEHPDDLIADLEAALKAA